MSEKRFTDIEHDYENARIRCKDNGMFMLYAIYENDDGLSTLGDLLNGQEELIKRLKTIREEQIETILKQKRKIKELTTQLQTEEESVCIKCKHHYLIKYPDESSKYYISKCIKEHNECSKEDIRYCEDFELKGDE